MISIFTPVHKTSSPFLFEAYSSLIAQTQNEFEWVIVPNGGGEVPNSIASDRRVKVVASENDDPSHNRIGRLKNFAASHCKGDVILELDADDILTPNALQEVEDAFQNPSVQMAYSNDAEFQNETWKSESYSPYWGWKSRDFIWNGRPLKEKISWKASPHMMRYIFWAPNHLRAWRTSTYWKLGGHDVSLKTGDDHELSCRYFENLGASAIHHIDQCLYLYRNHGNNSCKTNNDEVQIQNFKNYCRYRIPMAVKWAKDLGLNVLDLGGRFNAPSGFTTVDRQDADVICNLEERWPFEDNSVGVIRASHILEHLRDPIHSMNEAFRVLAPGGWMFIEVPSTDGRGAFQDPTHVSFWNENSFWYYTNEQYARFIRPQFKGRFQSSRVATYFPDQFMHKNKIPCVSADLIALKPPYDERPVGEVLI